MWRGDLGQKAPNFSTRTRSSRLPADWKEQVVRRDSGARAFQRRGLRSRAAGGATVLVDGRSSEALDSRRTALGGRRPATPPGPFNRPSTCSPPWRARPQRSEELLRLPWRTNSGMLPTSPATTGTRRKLSVSPAPRAPKLSCSSRGAVNTSADASSQQRVLLAREYHAVGQPQLAQHSARGRALRAISPSPAGRAAGGALAKTPTTSVMLDGPEVGDVMRTGSWSPRSGKRAFSAARSRPGA